MIPRHTPLRRAAICIALPLGLAACVLPAGTKDGENVTMIAPQVKVGFPQAGPGSLCNQTVRFWFEGDEIDPGVSESLDTWHVPYENLSPIDFFDRSTGGVTWHCVFGSPFASREPPYEGWEDNLHYEVLPLVPDSLVYDPATIVIYQGACAITLSEITELATNHVNFTTTASSCVISSSPLAGFP